MPDISAVIITFNEEDYISRCLSSLVGLADEIIVVDSFSTDRTEEICKNFRVTFIRHPFEGYVEQKNYALKFARNNFVLSLDADEALSEQLKQSIMLIKDNPEYDGYSFNRKNNFYGKWIRYSRWYPDRQLRLFDKRKGEWKGPNPHDKFRLNPGCRVGHLKGDLLHWYYTSFEEHIEKINRFSTISAQSYFNEGRKAGVFSGLLHMSWSFFRSYILRAGFLDGYKGFMACTITSWGSFLKYSKLRMLIREQEG